jgi:deoxyribodipyrimidine photolyase-related protein
MPNVKPPHTFRHLVLVLGDQLNRDASAFDGFDSRQDAVWMAEVAEESTHVWSSKIRTALFLSAMRHFAQGLRDEGLPLRYTSLSDAGNTQSLAAELARELQAQPPQAVRMTGPGDWRVLRAIQSACAAANVPLHISEDRHFYSSPRHFAAHAKGRKQLRMEYFYREMRREHGVLMDGAEPCGGQWNFDADNREAFGPQGPGHVPATPRYAPDAITVEVLAEVAQRFVGHPGELVDFGWPVTRTQALQALARFITERLPQFGRWQDAMWTDEPWLHHSHLSAALNLKLLNPREVVNAAEAAYRGGLVDLASAEGFIRQILGWREYVRGIYWLKMPEYAQMNALEATEPLPPWYWTGRTDMACLKDAIGQTLRLGYAHHIQRLMVTGLYALLLGVRPQAVHEWYLAVYVDAVEWVELPNTLGMSQFGDGGLMASKPYIASGKYLQRMGNHCSGCRYKPDARSGAQACPFTTLYWDFLARHESWLAKNPRTVMQVRNLARIPLAERAAIAERAAAIRAGAVGAS